MTNIIKPILGITGHRTISHPIDKIKETFREIIKREQPQKLISGMALGFDTIAAEIAIEQNIPLVAATPFAEQAEKWPQKDKEHYLELLSKAIEIYIHPQTTSGNKVYAGYFGRNRWIVENSTLLVAYMINDKDGGTAYTFDYAQKKGVRSINLVSLL